MNGGQADGPGRFRLLASAVAGCSMGVTFADAGDAAHTDGVHIFVVAGAPLQQQRRQVLVQAALVGGGSLEPDLLKRLRGRPKVARRYLAIEGHRVLSELATRVPLARTLSYDSGASARSADESLRVAEGGAAVREPPEWFGQIRPSRLRRSAAGRSRPESTEQDLRLEFKVDDLPKTDADDEDGEHGAESKLLKLFQNPLSKSNSLTKFLLRTLGMSRSGREAAAGGGDTAVRAIQQVDRAGPHGRPLPARLHFTDTGARSWATGVGGALYPEWDLHEKRYRPEWCRVLELPLRVAPDVAAAGVESDETLRRRLARLGLGPQLQRRRPDGDDIDVDALIEFAVDLQTGQSPTERIYLERCKLARNLGVLILVDASGSATETDPSGLSVHEHQRRAAATLALTLEELGDRVAVYGFRSYGRSAVHLLALKPFSTRFGAGGRAQLNHLRPSGYTRLGAAIRHAGELLKTGAGTPHRLLLVLSDGFPYDEGYESRYGEADAHRALEELRSDGTACLCLSIGSSTPTEALGRVFGSASHAAAATLGELSPRMDELFLGALKELAAPNPRPRRSDARNVGRRGATERAPNGALGGQSAERID